MMKFCWCADSFLFVIGACLVLVHASLRITLLLRTADLRHQCVVLCATLKRALSGCVQYCTNVLRCNKSDPMSPLDELVKRKVLQRRIEALRAASVILAHALTIPLVKFCVSTWAEEPVILAVTQMVCIMISMAMSIAMYSISSLTSMLVEMYYAAMMVISLIFMWSSPADSFALSMPVAFMTRFVVSVLHLNVGSVVFCNLVSFAVTCAYIAKRTVVHKDEVDELLLYMDLIGTILITVTSASIERLAVSVAHKEVNISNLTTENSSSMLLLDMVCDVVLELSNEFRIMRDSPSFAAFLMRAPGSSLMGESFTSLIDDCHERKRFQDFLAARTGSSRKVGTFHASISDALRNRLKVEIFFVRVDMDVGISHFLLGIREFRDSQLIALPSFESRTPKKRRPSKHNGTPPSFEQSCFEEKDAPPPATALGRLHYPQLKLTTDDARFYSIAASLCTWNINVDRTACCSYHAYIMAGKTTLIRLAQAPCDDRFPVIAQGTLQCQTCGIFDGEGVEGQIARCSVCASDDVRVFDGHTASTIELERNAAPRLSLAAVSL
eukprot:TRINITY_DN13634_c0_g1_i1.p1 TRINITY_DN13634_c0_g1~~TRINITY_DN13634_c0_g1_i1.p1  ORF type:complete len:554 (+),score=62.44 TRINITY_DN13634_c0_g1_i1:58-1719(+)